MSAGYHTVSWLKHGASGPSSAGVYFARLKTGGQTLTRKFVLLR
jgi:hypothetical protein